MGGGQRKSRGGVDSPQGQEKQEGSHKGCHRHAVAQVVDNERDAVVQVILPLLDTQTDTRADRGLGHVEGGAGHSSNGHPVRPDPGGRRGSKCHHHTWHPELSPVSPAWLLVLMAVVRCPLCNWRADLSTMYSELCQRYGYVDPIFFLILEWELLHLCFISAHTLKG